MRARGRSIFRSFLHARPCLLPNPTLDCASLPPYPPAIHLLFLRRHSPYTDLLAAFLAAVCTCAWYARVGLEKKAYSGDPPTSSRLRPFGFIGRGLCHYFRDYFPEIFQCLVRRARLSNSGSPFRSISHGPYIGRENVEFFTWEKRRNENSRSAEGGSEISISR